MNKQLLLTLSILLTACPSPAAPTKAPPTLTIELPRPPVRVIVHGDNVEGDQVLGDKVINNP